MTEWGLRCSCGFEADTTSERHYDMVDISVDHQVEAQAGEEHATEIYEVETDG